MVDPGSEICDRGQHSKLNCPILLRKELLPNRDAAEDQQQLLPGEKQ
jgi:hypothetical protein